ncbi:hypothetical protein BDD12DRAFT_515056 [Trichophaea hybrida]|nr:hypothetical protein BDD12DRAFT_515056 [Trichophaea hybrida]
MGCRADIYMWIAHVLFCTLYRFGMIGSGADFNTFGSASRRSRYYPVALLFPSRPALVRRAFPLPPFIFTCLLACVVSLLVDGIIRYTSKTQDKAEADHSFLSRRSIPDRPDICEAAAGLEISVYLALWQTKPFLLKGEYGSVFRDELRITKQNYS